MDFGKFALIGLTATAVLFVPRPGSARADNPPTELASATSKLIRYDDLKHKRLPQAGDVPAALSALDYEKTERPFAYVEDFNGDGVADFLLGTPNHRLCGTAGCPYLLIEGRSLKIIGDFFGTIAVLKRRTNGFPVIQTVAKRDLAATNLHTFVFDGRAYRLVSHSLLEARGLEEWHRNLITDQHDCDR